MTDQSPPPIVKTLVIPLPAPRAFHLFTEEMVDWWPFDTYSVGAQRPAKFDPPTGPGSHVSETRSNGETHHWGTVTDWDPPRRFAMTWHPGQSTDRATEVSVDFETVADGTKVTLIHAGWHALGQEAAEISARYDTGWTRVLAACKTACLISAP